MQNWWVTWQFSKMKEREVLNEAKRIRRGHPDNHTRKARKAHRVNCAVEFGKDTLNQVFSILWIIADPVCYQALVLNVQGLPCFLVALDDGPAEELKAGTRRPYPSCFGLSCLSTAPFG